MAERDRVPENASTGLFDFGTMTPFPNGIEVWLRFQSSLLAGLQSTMLEWVERQQRAAATVQGTLAKLQDCRDPAELVRIQQEFMAACADHASAEAGAFGETLRRLTSETATELEEARRRFAVMQWRDGGARPPAKSGPLPAPLRLIRSR
jgi:Phasin protein